MTKFSAVIHLLPLLWPLLVFVTIFTPYFIAVSLDHVSPFFPSICKTAAFEPEGSIFGVLMFFAVFFGVLAIFCRYFQFDGIQEDAKETFLQNLKWINKVSLPFSVSCLISVVLVFGKFFNTFNNTDVSVGTSAYTTIEKCLFCLNVLSELRTELQTLCCTSIHH